MLALGSVLATSPQSPAAGDAHGPGGDEQKISAVNPVGLGHAEELATRQRTVTYDRSNRQSREHHHEHDSNDPVRHPQMLVTHQLPWSSEQPDRPASEACPRLLDARGLMVGT